MATTRIISLHGHKGQTIDQTLHDRIDYVENPKQKGKSYKEWDERRKGQSWKGKLQETIDRVLPESRDFDDFLAHMRSEGYEVKLGKNISFRAPGQERFTRSKTLGPEYSRKPCESV